MLVWTEREKREFKGNEISFRTGCVLRCVVKAYCTIWGSWMSVRLLMRAWLRRASSFRRLSLCCSIILFSSSIVFRLHSIDEICFRVQNGKQIINLRRQKKIPAPPDFFFFFMYLKQPCGSKYLPGFGVASCLLLFSCWSHSVPWFHDPDVEYHLCFQHLFKKKTIYLI